MLGMNITHRNTTLFDGLLLSKGMPHKSYPARES